MSKVYVFVDVQNCDDEYGYEPEVELQVYLNEDLAKLHKEAHAQASRTKGPDYIVVEVMEEPPKVVTRYERGALIDGKGKVFYGSDFQRKELSIATDPALSASVRYSWQGQYHVSVVGVDLPKVLQVRDIAIEKAKQFRVEDKGKQAYQRQRWSYSE